MNAVFSSNLGSLLDDVDGEIYRRIPVSQIDPDPDQPRKEISQADIEERGNSLATEGQLQPIELVETASGRFTLVFGEIRWRGAMWKGLPDLIAKVHPIGTDPKQIRRRQLIENLQRKDMSAIDTANGIARLVKDEGSAAAAAKAIGKSEGQISKYLSVLNLPPITAELAGLDVTRDVETLTTIAKIERDDPAAARELLNEAKTTGQVSRARSREKSQEVTEAKRAAAPQPAEKKTTPAAKKAEAKSAPAPKPPADFTKPVKVKDGEALAITVKIVETSKDAKRFAKAKEEHGDPQLYQAGVAHSPDRCWVLFGDTPRAKRDDENPRLQEFPCSAIVLGMVTKFRPVTEE